MRDWRQLGLGVLIGAAVAFPAGVMFGGRDKAENPRPVVVTRIPGKKPQMRNVYAPGVAKDPYVIDQQRRIAEALALECREYGEHCAEAEQARQWLSEQD